MKYLVDSDWLIIFLNGRAQAVRLMATLEAADGIAVSTITLGKLLEGLPGVSAPEGLESYLQQLGPSVPLLPPDVNCAFHYSRIRLALRSTGNLIPDNDLWIAATALAYDLVLVSHDVHFQRVSALRML